MSTNITQFSERLYFKRIKRLKSMPSGKLTDWTPKGKSWFFGIGINDYVEFDNLSNAVRDVQTIQSILTTTYDIDESCVIQLFNQEATEEGIIQKLDYLSKEINDADKLIIYYSGHGRVNHELNRGYWIPHDAKKNSSSRYILNSTIQDYVGGIDAKHILLISDSCFSGSLFMRGEYRSADVSEELERRKSRWALCSGRADEEVYDGDIGGHSPFAQSLINSLTSAVSDTIPVGHIVHQVIEETASNYQQLPEGRPMFGVGHGGGQYVFRKKHSSTGSTTDPDTRIDQSSSKKSKLDQVGSKDNQNITSGSEASSNDSGVTMTKWIVLGVLGGFILVGAIIIWAISLLGDQSDENSNDNIHVVYDPDGENYPTVDIGNLEWMAVNMNYVSEKETDWSLLHDLDEVEKRGLGQLYAYDGAMEACSKLKGDGWRLPTASDFDLLATFRGNPPAKPNNTSGYGYAPEVADWISPDGSSGLKLQLGGKYFIDSDEFSPTSFNKLNSGHYWLFGNRILNISYEADSYFADVTSKVPWNHACSCRCVRNKH